MTTPATGSLAESMSLLSAEQRAMLLRELSTDEAERLLYDWQFWARPAQLAPAGDWRVWLLLAGRGFGKSRTGAEWVRAGVEAGTMSRIALVAETAADARDVMVEGESGILAISPPWFRPHYEPSKRRITWPNGALATTFSADDPEQLRGPQFDAAWADEAAKWRRPESWDNLMLSLRLGHDPRCVVTTTPKPVRLIRDLSRDPLTHVTRGSTFDNAAHLAPAFLAQIVRKYEGTRLGRQELNAELLDDVEGAYWTYATIEAGRVAAEPALARIVVAIDPAATSGGDSDETGICVAGQGEDGAYYVLHLAGYRLSPDGWARRAIALFDEYRADVIIAERNNGGEMVEATLRHVRDHAPIRTIVASRGKAVRAEPISLLYEQGRVHHVGTFAAAEDQMCAFPVAAEHDDLVDAMVYALTELSEGGGALLLWGSAA